jgi:mycothiol synthase
MAVPLDLPPGYRIRPPRADEASAVDGLSAASDAALGSPPILSEDLLREFWSRPRFDLEADAWVVEFGPELVGYAEVWGAVSSRLWGFAIVHPEHTGRGIGSFLAEVVERRATERAEGTARLYSAVLTQDAAAARLLGARGYTWARRFWNMDVELSGELKRPAPPAGVSLRALDPERDLPAAHRIIEEAFEDHWDFSPTSYEDFLDQSVRGNDFDPALWVLALDGEEPVGVLSGGAHTDRGWVYDLGVLRPHRGRGIATALLRESFRRFADRGRPHVRLNVDADNLTGAVALYERVGMRAVTSYDLWGRTVQGTGAPRSSGTESAEDTA